MSKHHNIAKFARKKREKGFSHQLRRSAPYSEDPVEEHTIDCGCHSDTCLKVGVA